MPERERSDGGAAGRHGASEGVEAGRAADRLLDWWAAGIIRERLEGRLVGVEPLDQSDADWQIYRKLGQADPIGRPQIVANTTVELDQIGEVIAARAGARRALDDGRRTTDDGRGLR